MATPAKSATFSKQQQDMYKAALESGLGLFHHQKGVVAAYGNALAKAEIENARKASQSAQQALEAYAKFSNSALPQVGKPLPKIKFSRLTNELSTHSALSNFKSWSFSLEKECAERPLAIFTVSHLFGASSDEILKTAEIFEKHEVNVAILAVNSEKEFLAWQMLYSPLAQRIKVIPDPKGFCAFSLGLGKRASESPFGIVASNAALLVDTRLSLLDIQIDEFVPENLINGLLERLPGLLKQVERKSLIKPQEDTSIAKFLKSVEFRDDIEVHVVITDAKGKHEVILRSVVYSSGKTPVELQCYDKKLKTEALISLKDIINIEHQPKPSIPHGSASDALSKPALTIDG